MQASVSECNKCEGTGYLSWKQPDNYPIGEVEFCTCQLGQRNRQYWDDSSKAKQAKHLSAMFESAGIPPRFRDLTIESLAAIKDPGKQSAIAAARTLVDMGYIESPKGPKFGLVLSGSFGMGKTGLLTPVLRHWLDRGRSALWCEVYDFIDAIQGGYSTGNSDAKLEAAQAADIILLDALGVSVSINVLLYADNLASSLGEVRSLRCPCSRSKSFSNSPALRSARNLISVAWFCASSPSLAARA